MADFDGMPLWNGEERRGGALLYLQRVAIDSGLIHLGGGVEVEVKARSRGLVVRGLAGADQEAMLAQAFKHASCALDILAIEGRLVAALADPDDEHVTWVDIDGETNLRLWAVVTMSMRMGIATLTVTDAEGNDVTTHEQQPSWHESFRYFRLSQHTDDLHDAFRNMYLALESVLTRVKPQGKEPEGEWVRRALRAAGELIDLSKFVEEDDREAAADALHRDIYSSTRNAVFHAKGNRPSYLPHDDAAEEAVLAALNRLARLYVDLASAVLGARYRSGGVFTHGFKMMTGSVRQGSSALIRGDTSDPQGHTELVASGDQPTVRVELADALDVSGPFLTTVRGLLDMTEINDKLASIARIALVAESGMVALVHTLEGELHASGIDKAELILGLKGRNSRLLRDYYAS